jgi:hypothetical protein
LESEGYEETYRKRKMTLCERDGNTKAVEKERDTKSEGKIFE